MNKQTYQKIMEIYESQIKMHIVNFLEIYHELSLTELSEKLEKSKSTISKHVKELLNIAGEGRSFIKVREEKFRGSIKQKIFSRNNIPLFFGKTYDEMKECTPEQMYDYLRNEEHLINIRFFSLLKEVISQSIEYINEFYAKISLKDLDDDFKEKIYRYNTCIPRIMYYTEAEYLDYRKKFIQFDEDFLKETEKKRLKYPSSVNVPKEYLVTHTLLPIKRILDKEFY